MSIKARSAWDDFAQVDSPNGLYQATFDDANEVCMGGPTKGVLTVCEKISGRSLVSVSLANCAFVWSDDSTAIAFPLWIQQTQGLAVARIPSGEMKLATGVFRILELARFAAGRIQGVDSPIHHPQPLDIASP